MPNNLFRLSGDMLHTLAVCIVLQRVLAKKNAQGERDRTIERMETNEPMRIGS